MMLALLVAFGCGTERWDVKTLTDRGVSTLQPTQKATVEELLSLRPPRSSKYGPRHRIERIVVTVDVEVLAFKSEPDDDIHAIIRGGRGHLMVAEFPASLCTTGSPYANQMELARRRFLSAMRRHVPFLRLTGVIFFDKLHGQSGGAPNGVELHPVLAVEAIHDGADRRGERRPSVEGEHKGREKEPEGE